MSARLRLPLLLAALNFPLAFASGQITQSKPSDRPDCYAPESCQFLVDTETNPRQVSILRCGAGPARPAEYHVFEWVDERRRLRPLHKAVLRNAYLPRNWRSVADGRYLVTFDDYFELQGETANTIVLYDFVRGKTAALRLRDFLPSPLLADRSEGQDWHVGPVDIDPVRHVVYPTEPNDCRSGAYAFLVIDLPSLTVRALPEAPERLPAGTYYETNDGHVWEWKWSMGDRSEPEWSRKFALPKLLKGTRVRDEPGMPASAEKLCYFRLDPDSDAYVRCTAEEWRDPPEIWTKAGK